ncbi:hypothetical protein OKW35_002218 [Paraburkholderia sp. MM5477-R1]
MHLATRKIATTVVWLSDRLTEIAATVLALDAHPVAHDRQTGLRGRYTIDDSKAFEAHTHHAKRSAWTAASRRGASDGVVLAHEDCRHGFATLGVHTPAIDRYRDHGVLGGTR